MSLTGSPIVLGIESSCDEMAAALVRDGREILAVSAREGRPSLWVFGSLAPYVDRLRESYDVKTLRRPEPLRVPPPPGLRRVSVTPNR